MELDDLTIVYKDVADLIPYARNPRKNDHAIDRGAAFIREFGFSVPMLIKSDLTIIDGHLRLKCAKKLKMKRVPCIIRDDLTDAQIKAFRLSINRFSELADWDDEMLKIELMELDNLQYDVDLLGFDIKLDKDNEGTEGFTDPDEVPEVPRNVFGVKRGDVWLLGNHRIMCGDSTDENDVKKLMNGQKADMMFTDPPYGVSYTKKTKEIFKSEEYTEIKNDEKTGEDLGLFFKKVFSNIIKFLTDTCSYYVCSPQGGDSEMMMMMMRESGMKCRHQIIWVKDAPVFSMGRLDYDYKHEPILYGWLKKHEFQRRGSQDKSVWEFKRTENKLHPTMKPVELIENAILNSSKQNDLISDFFLGSGSTLIACEKTGRTCYGMELDEHYCSVIIKRWQDFTGKTAIKEESHG